MKKFAKFREDASHASYRIYEEWFAKTGCEKTLEIVCEDPMDRYYFTLRYTPNGSDTRIGNFLREMFDILPAKKVDLNDYV